MPNTTKWFRLQDVTPRGQARRRVELAQRRGTRWVSRVISSGELGDLILDAVYDYGVPGHNDTPPGMARAREFLRAVQRFDASLIAPLEPEITRFLGRDVLR